MLTRPVYSLGVFSLCVWESDIRKSISFPEWPEKDLSPGCLEHGGWASSMMSVLPQLSSNHLCFAFYSVWVLICQGDFPQNDGRLLGRGDQSSPYREALLGEEHRHCSRQAWVWVLVLELEFVSLHLQPVKSSKVVIKIPLSWGM